MTPEQMLFLYCVCGHRHQYHYLGGRWVRGSDGEPVVKLGGCAQCSCQKFVDRTSLWGRFLLWVGW